MRICPTCFGLYGVDQACCPKDGAATEAHTQVLIGRKLGPYVVRSLVGEGGMGVVYAGEHSDLGKRVALKVLRPELSLRDDIVERFVQEARAVTTIGHANIVTIYDFGRTPYGSFYFVMEYLEGQTIRQLLELGEALPLDQVRLVVLRVGTALAAAHAKGFIHRDVKPENIMLVSRAGQSAVKLLDFGIVKLLSPGSQPRTLTGTETMGTPQYMCPEQLEDNPIDSRADVYSLGTVAYEMLTGSVPYPGRSPAEIRQMQLTRMPAPPSVCRTRSRLSRAIDAAVLWAITVDPAARPRRMEDFLTAFEDGYRRTCVEQSHPGPVARGRRRVLVGGLAAASAAFLGGLAVLLWQRSKNRPDVVGPTTSGPLQHEDKIVPAPRPGATEAVADPRQALLAALHSPATRAQAAEVVGNARRTSLAPELRRLLEDENPAVVKAAANALAALGDRSCIPALRRVMEDAVEVPKLHLAGALAQLGDDSGVRVLHRALRSNKPPIEGRSAVLLATIGDPTARDALRRHLKRGFFEGSQQRRTLGLLAGIGDDAAREELLGLIDQGAWEVRVEAAVALGKSNQRGLATLVQALEASQPARLRAAVGLADFGDERGRDTLIECLGSTDETGRRDAVLALARLPATPAAREALVRARADRSPAVALAATAALVPP